MDYVSATIQVREWETCAVCYSLQDEQTLRAPRQTNNFYTCDRAVTDGFGLAHLREFDDAVSSGAPGDSNRINGERVRILEYDARFCWTIRAKRTTRRGVQERLRLRICWRYIIFDMYHVTPNVLTYGGRWYQASAYKKHQCSASLMRADYGRQPITLQRTT